MQLRIGNVEIDTGEGEFQGFAAAAVAELQAAAANAVGTAADSWIYHLQLALIFAQLETAHQLELLRTEGVPTRDHRYR